MHVIAHDPYASADRARAIGVELVSMEEAMTTADFISLHMPLTPATDKMLNDEAFAKMKKGVRIVNVARGGVIDEDALVRALDAGIVAQVCLVLSALYFTRYKMVNICFPQLCLYIYLCLYTRLLLTCSLKSLQQQTASWCSMRMLP